MSDRIAAFDRIIDILLPDGGFVMLMEAYFDASGGTHPTRVVSMGGYLFDADRAKALNAKWDHILRPYLKGLPPEKRYFHMTDFMSRQEKPWSELGDAERLVLRRELVESAKESGIVGAIVAVKIEDFDKAQDKVKEILSSPFNACGTRVIDLVSEYVKEHHPGSEVAYVFEAGDAGQNDLSNFLNKVPNSPRFKDRFRYGSHGFVPKTNHHALAAADMLAWEYRTAVEQDIIDGRMADAPRVFLNLILEKPMMMAYLHPANLGMHAMLCLNGFKVLPFA